MKLIWALAALLAYMIVELAYVIAFKRPINTDDKKLESCPTRARDGIDPDAPFRKTRTALGRHRLWAFSDTGRQTGCAPFQCHDALEGSNAKTRRAAARPARRSQTRQPDQPVKRDKTAATEEHSFTANEPE